MKSSPFAPSEEVQKLSQRIGSDSASSRRILSDSCTFRCPFGKHLMPCDRPLYDSVESARSAFMICMSHAFDIPGTVDTENPTNYVCAMGGVTFRLFSMLPDFGEQDVMRIRRIYLNNMENIRALIQTLSSISFLFEENMPRRGAVALFLHELNNILHILQLFVSPNDAVVINADERVHTLIQNIVKALSNNRVDKEFSLADIQSNLEQHFNGDSRVSFVYATSLEALSVPPNLIIPVIENFTRGALSRGATKVCCVFIGNKLHLVSDLEESWVSPAEFSELLSKPDEGVVSGRQGYFYSDRAVSGALGRKSGHALSLQNTLDGSLAGLCQQKFGYLPRFAVSVDLV